MRIVVHVRIVVPVHEDSGACEDIVVHEDSGA